MMEAPQGGLESMLARHRVELKELQGRIANKKRSATKRRRRAIDDECASMERQLRERHEAELAAAEGTAGENGEEEEESEEEKEVEVEESQEPKTELRTGVEDELAALRLKTDAAVQEPKKRNRQRERLARRAAEREAAAQQAEEEAGQMTDHRAREGDFMKKKMDELGLEEVTMEPDGHCLFAAMADQLACAGIGLADEGEEAKEAAYRRVRRAAADWMAERPDDFAPFLDEALGPYLERIREAAEWGGQLELMALARRYKVQIRVLQQDGRTERIGGDADDDDDASKSLWLAYYRHGFGLGEHYNSLRKKRGGKV